MVGLRNAMGVNDHFHHLLGKNDSFIFWIRKAGKSFIKKYCKGIGESKKNIYLVGQVDDIGGKECF